MLDPTQRAKLISGIPTVLGSTTLTKMRKDRFVNMPSYPAMRISILSQGVKLGPTTAGPIKCFRDENGDVQRYYGELDRATVSVSLECMSEVSGTDLVVQEKLDDLAYYFLVELKNHGIGLDWARDNMKLSRVEHVSSLPPYFDKFQNRWIYRQVVDFAVEYLFKVLEDAPNIHAADFDFGLPIPPTSHIKLVAAAPRYYCMDIQLQGWRILLPADILIEGESEVGYSFNTILVV